MRRRLILLALAPLVVAPPAAALARSEVRALVRIAQKTSGLRARAAVQVRTEPAVTFRLRRARALDRAYPRAAQAHDETVFRALGLTDSGGSLRRTLLRLDARRGLYDPASNVAYVQAGGGERAAALHEVVHALQDQHFDLRRLERLARDGDAARAAAAIVEGHARLATDVLAPRRTSSAGGARLTRFLELRRGFPATVGLRFAADLRNLGGGVAVHGALRRLPATTEQVFHLDKYLERERARPVVLPRTAADFALGSSATFGELDVRALLAVFGAARVDRAASGWGGGRTAVYRGPAGDAVVVALDWDTARDAEEWEAAVDILAARLPTERSLAFVRDASRTRLVLTASADEATALAEELLRISTST